jgi:hypothetical protein
MAAFLVLMVAVGYLVWSLQRYKRSKAMLNSSYSNDGESFNMGGIN